VDDDAEFGEDLFDVCAGAGFFAGQQVRCALNHGDRTSEGGEQKCELAADGAATDDEHAGRQSGGAQGVVAGPDRH
jgi:hypothetical protein